MVFGDGDESHQIYTNISGIIITWNTCADDTFNVLHEELADMFGVDPQSFYIAYYSKYIRDEFRARDLPHGAWVSINFRLRGGGKVKKDILKVKKAPKPPQDLIITKAFEMTKEVLHKEEMHFDAIMKNCSNSDLESMVNFIKHDKTTNSKKIENLGERTSVLADIITVRNFLDDIIVKGRDMVHDAIVTSCADESGLKIGEILKKIEIEMAVRSHAGLMKD